MTKQPTTLQELDIEIDKAEKQLKMIKASEDVLLKRLIELKNSRLMIQPDKLVGTEFFGLDGKLYKVTKVDVVMLTGVEFVYYSNMLKDGTLGKTCHSMSKESFLYSLNNGIYTKTNAYGN